MYNDKITTIVIRLMLVSLLLHSAFAIFIYGENELFSFDMKVFSLNGSVQVDEEDRYNDSWSDLWYRIMTSPFFVILFIVTIFVLIIDIFFNDLLSKAIKKKQKKRGIEGITGTYFDNFKIINYNDFPKYDFRLAEEYITFFCVNKRYKIMLKAWGDKNTSHMGRSLETKNTIIPKRSKFSTAQNSDRNVSNLESVRTNTVFHEKSDNVQFDINITNNIQPEGMTRSNSAQFYHQDIENRPLQKGNDTSNI